MSARQCVVIEIGSVFIRGGFAGEGAPNFAFESSLLAVPADDEENLMTEVLDSLHRIFSVEIQTKAKDVAVLVIEKFNFKKNLRDAIVTVLMRDFQVISVCFQPDLYMGMIGSLCGTGVILSIGDQESQAICFAQGRPLINTYKAASVGVLDAVLSLDRIIESKLRRKLSAEAVRPVFEHTACVLTKESNVTVVSDITVIPSQRISKEEFTLTGAERQQCLHCLLVGESKYDGCVDEEGGLAGLLLRALKSCSSDVRLKAMANIIVCGGGAMVPGVPYAICEKAQELTLTDDRFKALAGCVDWLPNKKLQPLPCPFLRSNLIWIGGSIFAALQGNHDKFIRIEDLKERVSSSTTTEPHDHFHEHLHISYECPDWMSLDPADWTFMSPVVSLNRVDETVEAVAEDVFEEYQQHNHSRKNSWSRSASQSSASSGAGGSVAGMRRMGSSFSRVNSHRLQSNLRGQQQGHMISGTVFGESKRRMSMRKLFSQHSSSGSGIGSSGSGSSGSSARGLVHGHSLGKK